MNDSTSVDSWLRKQSDAASEIELSVIIPAFNEERRLPPTLIDTIDFLDAHYPRYEILVVDDGSRDGTASVVDKIERIRKQVRLIRLPANQGKGYAVKCGALNARGARILFADADGATPFSELSRLMKELDAGADIAVGSRAMADEDTAVKTRWYRKYIGRTFNLLVNTLLLPDIKDTQCGFKLFTRQAARFLFTQQTAHGFSFDVEILFLARLCALRTKEVAINWTNVPGSKVNLFLDPLRMFRDLLVFRVRHRHISRENFLAFPEA